MAVELCEGETVRRRLRVSASDRQARNAWVLELEDPGALAGLRAAAERASAASGSDAVPLDGWTIRLRSDRRAALEALGRAPWESAGTREPCWSGTVRLPALGTVSPESPPARSYRLEFSDEFSPNLGIR
jgi:hypothetical protein